MIGIGGELGRCGTETGLRNTERTSISGELLGDFLRGASVGVLLLVAGKNGEGNEWTNVTSGASRAKDSSARVMIANDCWERRGLGADGILCECSAEELLASEE